MSSNSTDVVRCPRCNSIDINQFLSGTTDCDNCGMGLGDVGMPEQNNLGSEPARIYPLLTWSWAPCQRCGSTQGEEGGPEDDTCVECGSSLLAILRRSVAEGRFPESVGDVSAVPEPKAHVFAEGDFAINAVDGTWLVGAGPFMVLRVVGVRADGLLDVASTEDGTTWTGVSQRHLFRMA